MFKYSNIFDSDLEIKNKFTIYIPFKLYLVMKKIASVIDTEWSILVKERERIGVNIYLAEDFYIPKQEVTSTSVDYLENLEVPRKNGYIAVIHSHPFTNSKPSFSSADKESINTFPISIVVNKDISDYNACVSFLLDNVILQLEADIEIELEDIDIDISKITEKKIEVTYYQSLIEKEKRKKKKHKHDLDTALERGWSIYD